MSGWGKCPTVSYLNTVVAGCHSTVLDLDIGGWVGELAVGVRAGALLPLVLPAHLELQPAGVLLVQEGRHVEHCHGLLRLRDDKSHREKVKIGDTRSVQIIYEIQPSDVGRFLFHP